VLLDRRRIKRWQKWIYALMAVLMVAFLVYIPVGTQGCGSGTAATQTPSQRIAALLKQLQASPGAATLLLSVAQAYQTDAAQQAQGSAKQTSDLQSAATYYRRYLDATKSKTSAEARASRVETLQYLAAVYSQLKQWTNVANVYTELTTLEPTNADFFLNLGSAYIQAGQTKQAMLALGRFLQLDPNAPQAPTVRTWIKQNGGTLPSSEASPSVSSSPSSSANPSTSPSP
jgi:tetratricopeptide (TPR) repeat protein